MELRYPTVYQQTADSSLIRRQELECADWEGHIFSWANQSGWAARILQEIDELNWV